MYTLSEAEYEIKDMLHFDGETIEEWIDRDLRRIAIEDGYVSVPTSRELDTDKSEYGNPRVWFTLVTERKADGSAIYNARLHSSREVPKAG